MVPVIDQPRPESVDAFGPIAAAPHDIDVPGLMADRIGNLYADAERLERAERTERLIRAAEQLQ